MYMYDWKKAFVKFLQKYLIFDNPSVAITIGDKKVFSILGHCNRSWFAKVGVIISRNQLMSLMFMLKTYVFG